MSRSKRSSIAFQGEPGAFSFSAATKLLGKTVPKVPCESFKHVFEALKSDAVRYAIVPIENTLHGSIHENYDYLLQYNFSISGETSIRISHHLIGLPGMRLSAVREVFSHPVALNQCRDFFSKHARITPKSFYDTAGSVKMLAEARPPFAAAIASATAAEIYGCRILKRNLEDDRRNFTRFFLLSKQAKMRPRAGARWKTTVAFSTANSPGALFRAMGCFALRDLNLTKIESRPLARKPWEYLFYLDVVGSQHDPVVSRALSNLREMSSFLRVLGSYQPTL